MSRDERQLVLPLVSTARTHKHPRRRVVRFLGEVRSETRRVNRYELDCGHTLDTPYNRAAKSADCKACFPVPRAHARLPRRGLAGFRARSAAQLRRAA